MQLKSLELLGFKSFPEKTVLHFDESVTAVVGPNGSGKSNISDALRWVMGEQSTRALRGGKMEDVIFGGTQQRRGLGFAEVSLILDNENGDLPLEGAEACITRRYYRSGDSEYYINGRICRLRDINELFMDTGLGQEGYAMIGQGKIDEILSIKSTKRREIFEEAAGISRYRHRKEEAERKLAGTRDNLLRIHDKLEELELQMTPLEKQAAKARRYFGLAEELRGLEVSLWIARLCQLREEQAAVNAACAEAKAALEEEERGSEALYLLSEELREQAQQKDLQAQQKANEQRELLARLAATAQRLSVLEVQAENLQTELERLAREQEARAAKRALAAEQAAREAREAERLFAEGQAAAAALAAQDAQQSTQQSKLQEKNEALRALQLRREQETQAAARIAAHQAALEASARELATQEGALLQSQQQDEQQAAQVRARLRQHQQLCADLQARQAQQMQQLEAEEAAKQKASAALEEARKALEALRLEESRQQQRLTLLGDMERHNEGYARAVKTVMDLAKEGRLSGLHGPLASRITVPRDLALAIETALGGALQNLIVSTQEDGKRVLQELRRRDGGRVTCLPLDAIRARAVDTRAFEGLPGYLGLASDKVSAEPLYGEIIRHLLGRVLLAEDLDAGIGIAKNLGYRYRIVTRDGQLLAPGGAMTGGSNTQKGGILSRAGEQGTLKESLLRLEKESSAAEARVACAQQQKSRSEARCEEAAGALSLLRQELFAAETEQRALLRQQEEQQKAAAQAQTCFGALRARQKEAQQGEADAATRLQALRVAGEANASQSEQLHEDREALQAQLEAIQSARREQQTALAVLAAEGRAAEGRRQESGARVQALDEESAHEAQEIARARERLAALEAERTERADAGEDEGRARIEAEETLARITGQKLQLEARRVQNERALRLGNERLLQAQQVLAKKEQQKQGGEAEESALLEKLWERYELSHEQARELAQPLPDPREAERRIASLRGEIRSLGQVNLGAVEEYERLHERFDFLDTQRRDVEAAEGQLLTIIADLTEQMRGIFAREFARIREAFSSTFRELFGGGSADLLLEEGQDILESGIEIRVQPPGKSLKTLSLLSGGEKAFVAIALYFAILKVRPTPFCVLDEIEAALDDANVTRFAQYLRRMSDKTQFIVITHRRGTMEEADILYGVTMEQQGVSRILRLAINELEKSLKLG